MISIQELCNLAQKGNLSKETKSAKKKEQAKERNLNKRGIC